MKWKHKKLGWTAQTSSYNDIEHLTEGFKEYESVIVSREKDERNINLPISFVTDDDAWEPIHDDRWQNFSFTIREFMDALQIEANEFNATKLKLMADRVLTEHIAKHYK